MELTISAQAIEGYEYQASIEGGTAEDIITKRAEGQGQTYYQYKQQAKVQDIINKVAEDPDAYVAAVEAVHEAKVKEADEKAKLAVEVVDAEALKEKVKAK